MKSGGPHSAEGLWQAAGAGFRQLFQAASGYEVIPTTGGMLALTGVAAPDLNCGVIWAADDAEAVIRTFANELRNRTLPGILLVADDVSRHTSDILQSSGMVAAARMPLMTRGPGLVPASARFTVRRARSPEDLATANRLIAAAFELPVAMVDAAFGPHLLASADVAVAVVEDGDEPVGCLQTTAHDGLVGIWSMATPPAHRRRGIARAGLSHILTSRLAGDTQLAFLIATEAGLPLYTAVGFQVVAWSTLCLVPPHDAR